MTDSQDRLGKEGPLENRITRRALLGGMALGGAAVKLFRDAPQQVFLPQLWQEWDLRSQFAR